MTSSTDTGSSDAAVSRSVGAALLDVEAGRRVCERTADDSPEGRAIGDRSKDTVFVRGRVARTGLEALSPRHPNGKQINPFERRSNARPASFIHQDIVTPDQGPQSGDTACRRGSPTPLSVRGRAGEGKKHISDCLYTSFSGLAQGQLKCGQP